MNDQLRDRSRTPVSPRDRERNSAKDEMNVRIGRELRERCGTRKASVLNALCFPTCTSSSIKLAGMPPASGRATNGAMKERAKFETG